MSEKLDSTTWTTWGTF